MDGSPKNEYEKIYANARSIEEAEKDHMEELKRKINNIFFAQEVPQDNSLKRKYKFRKVLL
jgi:hypothetical protein